MGDVFSSLVELRTDRIQHASHSLSAVQHTPSLFVRLYVVFNLPLQLLVHLLVLDYLKHEGVDVCVEDVVLGGERGVVVLEAVSLEDAAI